MNDFRNKITISVIGSGLMGHGIALDFALSGFKVYLNDISKEKIDLGFKLISETIDYLSKSRKLDKKNILKNIIPEENLRLAVCNANIVIEAVYEDLNLKKDIFKFVEKNISNECILLSNTSTFLPSDITEDFLYPERFAISHYYNPPYLLPGLEIVAGEKTSKHIIEFLINFYRSIDKKPSLVKKEIKGFVGNRLQVALLRESLKLVEEGYATPGDIDEIVKGSFGRRLSAAGPFELREIIGLDLGFNITKEIISTLGNSKETSKLISSKILDGDLGVKTGKGFYQWTDEKKQNWKKHMLDWLILLENSDKNSK